MVHAMVTKLLEHGIRNTEKLDGLKQLVELSFDFLTTNRIAIARAFALRPELTGLLRIFALGPACSERRLAVLRKEQSCG